MKTKFESNVATQIPKTKMTKEPRLPWEEVRVDLQSENIVSKGTKPLGMNPVFLIALLIFIFAGTFSVVFYIVKTNEDVRIEMQKIEEKKALLENDLESAARKMNVLKEKNVQLDTRNNELKDQNKNVVGQNNGLLRQNEGLMKQNKNFMMVIKELSSNENKEENTAKNKK